jgi:hypothetical protein
LCQSVTSVTLACLGFRNRLKRSAKSIGRFFSNGLNYKDILGTFKYYNFANPTGEKYRHHHQVRQQCEIRVRSSFCRASSASGKMKNEDHR